MSRCAFETLSELCVLHSTRSVKRHRGSGLFLSKGDFKEENWSVLYTNVFQLETSQKRRSAPEHRPSVVSEAGADSPRPRHQANIHAAPWRFAPFCFSIRRWLHRSREGCRRSDSPRQTQHCSKAQNPSRKVTFNSQGCFSQQRARTDRAWRQRS